MQGEKRLESGAYTGYVSISSRFSTPQRAARDSFNGLLELARAESRHHGLFFRLARECFDAGEVESRAAALLDFEARLVADLPHRAAVH